MASETLLLESLEILATEDGDVLYTEGASSGGSPSVGTVGPVVMLYPAIRSAFLTGGVGMLTSGMDLSLAILDVIEESSIGLYNEDHEFLIEVQGGSSTGDPVPLTSLGWSASWEAPVTVVEVTSSDIIIISPLDPPAGRYGAAALVFWTGDAETSRLVAYWNLTSDDASLNVPAGAFVRIGWDDPNLGNRVFTI